MKKVFRFRKWIQAASAVIFNADIPNFFTGAINMGSGKQVCVPVLNCYSCPGALGACPIGSAQAVLSGRKHSFPFYVLGIVLLFGLILGRIICGFLCPFGWIQGLLNKIPLKKLRIPRRIDKPLRLTKYGILILFVIALPVFAVDAFGLGAPWFCKWICPAGTLEGGIPLLAHNESLRNSVGFLFYWKLGLLIFTVVASILIYRPFCKYVCPLGAFYALLNRIAILRMRLDKQSCISCGRCEKICPMQVDVLKNINSAECIRCGRCASACPVGAISLSTCCGSTTDSLRQQSGSAAGTLRD